MDEELGEKQYSVPDLLRGFLSGFFGFVESLVWGDSSYKQINRKTILYTLNEFMVLQKKCYCKVVHGKCAKSFEICIFLFADLFTILQHYLFFQGAISQYAHCH